MKFGAAALFGVLLSAACRPLPAERPAVVAWPVDETLSEWVAVTGCVCQAWALRLEPFALGTTYGVTLRADVPEGPVRATTIYTGRMRGDRDLFRRVLLHELVHVHSPAGRNDHDDSGLMANRIQPGELTPDQITNARAWCALTQGTLKL